LDYTVNIKKDPPNSIQIDILHVKAAAAAVATTVPAAVSAAALAAAVNTMKYYRIL
jgi:hypothetical protein